MPIDDRQPPEDLTPVVGAATDIAPLAGGPKPPHERTADEERGAIDWKTIAASEGFRALLKQKRRFILPATIFFVLYYFALPYLVGYHPALMQRKVWGEINWAYAFALSQFFMAWALAAIYVSVSASWDRKAKALLARFAGKRKTQSHEPIGRSLRCRLVDRSSASCRKNPQRSQSAASSKRLSAPKPGA